MCTTGLVPEATVSGCSSGGEAGGRDPEPVNADGRLGQFKFSVVVGGGSKDESRIGGLQRDLSAGERPVPWIVDHAMHGSENTGLCRAGGCNPNSRGQEGKHTGLGKEE